MVALAMTVVVTVAFTGCGRKGPLEPHPADPRRSSAPEMPASAGPGSLQPGPARQAAPPVIAPDRPFILDVLL